MGELDGTYGAMLIGVFISAILFGLTNLQMFMYFKEYPRDVIWNKLSVGWLWVLDALHLAFCLHMLYWYLITNYLDPIVLLDVVWSFKAQIIVDAIVVISVHTLYTIRVWKLNVMVHQETSFQYKRLLPAIVSFGMLAGYAAALVLCYEIDQVNVYTDLFQPDLRWVTYYPLATATGMDLIIAGCLCHLLVRCRTGFRSTDSIITWLMFYTIDTGIVTSMCSITAIVMMAVFPHTFAVIAVEFSLTKLYVNSYMAMFNARNSLRTPGLRTQDGIALHHINPLSSGSTSDHKTAFSSSHTTSPGTFVDGHRSHVPMVDIGVRDSLKWADSTQRLGQKQAEYQSDATAGSFGLISAVLRTPPEAQVSRESEKPTAQVDRYWHQSGLAV